VTLTLGSALDPYSGDHNESGQKHDDNYDLATHSDLLILRMRAALTCVDTLRRPTAFRRPQYSPLGQSKTNLIQAQILFIFWASQVDPNIGSRAVGTRNAGRHRGLLNNSTLASL